MAQLLAEGGFEFAVSLVSLGKRGVTISLGVSLSLCHIDRLRSRQDRERQAEGAVDYIRSCFFLPPIYGNKTL